MFIRLFAEHIRSLFWKYTIVEYFDFPNGKPSLDNRFQIAFSSYSHTSNHHPNLELTQPLVESDPKPNLKWPLSIFWNDNSAYLNVSRHSEPHIRENQGLYTFGPMIVYFELIDRIVLKFTDLLLQARKIWNFLFSQNSVF